MERHPEHHAHVHGPRCGHTAIEHGDHVDYLHEGHLHSPEGVECALAVTGFNPARCTPSHACGAHDRAHVHGPGCGHEAVPHGDHVCYLVGNHLHHPHDGHCDDHGDLRKV